MRKCTAVLAEISTERIEEWLCYCGARRSSTLGFGKSATRLSAVLVLFVLLVLLFRFPSFPPGPVKPFCKSTFFHELLFKLAQLLMQKVIRLMNQAHQCVGGDLRRGFLDIGLIGQIGSILFVSQSPNHL